MTIADLLARELSRPAQELAEYVVTDRIQAEYERLFSAMAAALRSPDDRVGIWISGPLGSGKSSFVKNLGSALAPYEIFSVNLPANLAAATPAERFAEVMYRALLRQLHYAEDYDISELEIELEKDGQLAAFQDLCRADYSQQWRDIRNAGQKFVCASSLLHRLAPQTYDSADAWLQAIRARPSRRPGAKDLVEKAFQLCGLRHPGKTFAFIVDEIGPYDTLGAERMENLRAIVEQFGRESLQRLKAGTIPGPVWIVVTAQEKLREVSNHLAASRITQLKLQDHFRYQIELSSGDIREVVAHRLLRKKETQEPALSKLFRDHGASLLRNVKLERSSRRSEFDEHQFVRFYPYLPHLIDLSMEILAGIRQHPNRPKQFGGSTLTIIQHSLDMLWSDRTRFADQPVGALVSIDKTYELLEANIPSEKRKEIREIRQRFDNHEDHPGMAERVAKAICLMEFVKTDLPRTTTNIAALLIQNVSEDPPTLAVAQILDQLNEAQFVRETEAGWTLYDYDELRRRAAALRDLRNAVGAVNPRPPGWRNDLIQTAKKVLARFLSWYTGPLYEFDASVSRSLEEVVRAVDHLTTGLVALDRLSIKYAFDYLPVNLVALEEQLAQLDSPEAPAAESMQAQVARLHQQVKVLVNLQKTANVEPPANGMESARGIGNRADEGRDRTTYLIGLFGTGRRYLDDLLVENIGERAKYFRDGIRLHPGGPTPMIYSGHVTIKYPSRGQEVPEVMRSILESVKSGFADLIFLYRHPLDSLLTNWVWWRTYIRDNREVSGISAVYQNTDDLCADLTANFLEFKSFAEGDHDFFAAAPGPRFLSFQEFVEETELQLESNQLTLRLEDFTIDPRKEFSKIMEVMSIDLDLDRLSLARPRATPYGHLAVRERVPEFRNFIDGLDAETRKRIENIGYQVS
jgi:hypothetical protein